MRRETSRGGVCWQTNPSFHRMHLRIYDSSHDQDLAPKRDNDRRCHAANAGHGDMGRSFSPTDGRSQGTLIGREQCLTSSRMELADFVKLGCHEPALRFLVIGGYAVAAHGHTRATFDVDFLVRRAEREAWSARIHVPPTLAESLIAQRRIWRSICRTPRRSVRSRP